jgi:glycosyltransferase involved in cell wall biosynthesis
MRLAVFTNQFPGRTATFFARDIRGLIDAGIDVEVFPIYPLDSSLWKYVPELLNEKVLPPSKVHHLAMRDCIRGFYAWPPKKLTQFLADTFSISASALQYGLQPLAKSSYVFLKAWAWSQQFPSQFDHILAYWGNYAATCAYVYHRLLEKKVPFSLFLHAGTDLYRTPVFMREKLLYAENVITCSQFNEQYLNQKFASIAGSLSGKIFVHRHGLDFGEFQYHSNSREQGTVIAVGRLEPEKGYEYLVAATKELKRLGLDIKVEFVGDGSQLQMLKSITKELGLADQIMFQGWKTPAETRAALGHAAVLVHPSPFLGDGVPNVIKEAMAVGTPVIASQVAGIPELLGNGEHGTLVPPKNTTALATAIKRVLLNDSLRIQHSQRARVYAEQHFDLWRNGERLAQRLGQGTEERKRSDTQSAVTIEVKLA